MTVASGGASGAYLENACDDAESLASAYAQVLDATGSERLELDVERGSPPGRSSTRSPGCTPSAAPRSP